MIFVYFAVVAESSDFLCIISFWSSAHAIFVNYMIYAKFMVLFDRWMVHDPSCIILLDQIDFADFKMLSILFLLLVVSLHDGSWLVVCNSYLSITSVHGQCVPLCHKLFSSLKPTAFKEIDVILYCPALLMMMISCEKCSKLGLILLSSRAYVTVYYVAIILKWIRLGRTHPNCSDVVQSLSGLDDAINKYWRVGQTCQDCTFFVDNCMI